MRTPASCAIAALAVAALAQPVTAFILHMAAVPPHGSLYPTSGRFLTRNPAPAEEGIHLFGCNTTIDNDAATWTVEFDAVMASTWLAVDPYGPKGPLASSP